jgi:hypothetical protein
VDLKSKLVDKKMGKENEPKTEMSLDEALALVKSLPPSEEKQAEPEVAETAEMEDGDLSPKGGLAGWLIRHIKNAGPIQKHNDDLREAQAAAVRG